MVDANEYMMPDKPTCPFGDMDLFIFNEEISESLDEILKKISERSKGKGVSLMVDRDLTARLDFFTGIKKIQQLGIKVYGFDQKPQKNKDEIFAYLISAELEKLEVVLHHAEGIFTEYNQHKDPSLSKNYCIIFVPRVNGVLYRKIQESNMRTYITVYSFNMDTIVLDYDLVSLEDNRALRDLYVNDNYDSLIQLSQFLVKFEDLFGKIKNRYIKGNLSKKLISLLEKEEQNSEIESKDEILGCIVLDRSIDFIPALLSPMTYEGLLHYYFDIKYNIIKVDDSVLGDKDKKRKYYYPKEEEKKEEEKKEEKKNPITKIFLNTTYTLYYIIKDYHFEQVKYTLKRQTELTQEIDKTAKAETDLKKLPEVLTKYKYATTNKGHLSDHVSLALYITDQKNLPKIKERLHKEQLLIQNSPVKNIEGFISNMIAYKEKKYEVLRLLCLEIITTKSLKQKKYEQLKRDYLFTYGYQDIFLLNALEKVNLMDSSTNTFTYSRNYSYLYEKLNLLNPEVNLRYPNDTSYAFSSYCPISIRLIERIFEKGWGNTKEILSKIDGVGEFPSDESEMQIQSLANCEHDNYILIIFIGGITFGEIGAIRYLSQKYKNVKFIFITTKVLNSNNFFEGMENKDIKFEFPDLGSKKEGNN